MEPLAMSIPEAARACAVGHTRFREEVTAGRVETVRIGRRRLVTRRALEEYVALLELEAGTGGAEQ